MMRATPICVATLLAGCGGSDGQTGAEFLLDIADYHGLTEDASWSYRDDGLDDLPIEAELVRARHQGDGLVELRRGQRWADADMMGSIEWDASDGLSLVEMEFEGRVASGPWRLADREPAEGDQHKSNGLTCVTTTVGDVYTYYAVFDALVQFDCVGDSPLAGVWTFGEALGLVRYDGPELTLDLVAPW